MFFKSLVLEREIEREREREIERERAKCMLNFDTAKFSVKNECFRAIFSHLPSLQILRILRNSCN